MSIDRREPSSGDPLDDLLASARWPAPNEAATRRLEAAWAELCRPSRRLRWRIGPALSVAAAVMVAAGAWVAVTRDAIESHAPAGMHPSAIASGSTSPTQPAPVWRPTVRVTYIGREPTALELARLDLAERLRIEKAAAGPRPDASSPPAEVEIALESQLARQIALTDGRVTPELAARFCAVATPRNLPLVLKLSERPATRAAAAEAMARLADAATLSRFARAEATPAAERQRLIRGMISRLSAADVPHYLELVGEPATRDAALAAMELDAGSNGRLAGLLLARLDDPRADLRVAAALALGRLDSPDVTRMLIDRVANDRNRREAFLALASSRADAAEAFMKQAASSEQFAGIAQSAVVQVEGRRRSDSSEQQQYCIEQRS